MAGDCSFLRPIVSVVFALLLNVSNNYLIFLGLVVAIALTLLGVFLGDTFYLNRAKAAGVPNVGIKLSKLNTLRERIVELPPIARDTTRELWAEIIELSVSEFRDTETVQNAIVSKIESLTELVDSLEYRVAESERLDRELTIGGRESAAVEFLETVDSGAERDALALAEKMKTD